MTSRLVICVAAILRAFPCQQFAGPLETCPGAIYRAYDRRPAAQRHDLSPNRIIEITGPVYI
ncbi:hypothetical protein [Rhizobium leguminosarum]|uniref:hypothetical protein n=1 Tax=Rhizobium leguminosarum TaxID=384 RepID=UPI00103AA766|nr:hypothetical protein [Rhizobium leguminosarum]TBZ49166.1 hypothetical protein E0H44_07810 [Rhizobium leguminosarum bv. viciae]TCA19803.1 hypothetical protein E0H68_00345 [Rhizobium leguminosarum bv. viciae]TCA23996.1 hypothetical protein E0H67_10470 [Rhizobium leguminosarum bv. viciae]